MDKMSCRPLTRLVLTSFTRLSFVKASLHGFVLKKKKLEDDTTELISYSGSEFRKR